MYTQYIHSLPQSRLGTANYALITSSFCYHGHIYTALYIYIYVGAFHGILPQVTKSLQRQRLRKSVFKQQPDKQQFHGNQQSQQYMNCCKQCLHLGRPQDINRDIREEASVTKMTRTSLHVHSQQCSPRGTFCKSPVTSDRSRSAKTQVGNQLDQLTLWLHQTSLNSTPHRVSPSEDQAHSQQFFKLQRHQQTSTTSRPGIAINCQPVTSRVLPQKLRIMQVVYLPSVIKSAYHLQSNIVAIPTNW
jgi:hypothetical protein